MHRITRGAVIGTLLASTALGAPAFAQEAPAPDTQADAETNSSGYGEIIVTAQKRSESLQNVPISIQALGTQKLQDLNISNFTDYVQQLPSVTFQSLGGSPGTNVIYMRGVASGGDGNHSGSLPSVGVYLDEQPVTTIGGNLDVHVYDIARIESLAGPQGTLYGASSEAGTIRIITNKPDTSATYGRVDAELNTITDGGIGGKVEGFFNAPLGGNAALRVVGWYKHDAGFIDNVPGTRCFLPQPGGICVDNDDFVEEDYNDADIVGGRAALAIDLDEDWTVTPSVIYQNTKSHGTSSFDPQVGDLQIQRFFPEYRDDEFVQASLTIQGRLGNWDLVSATSYLDRQALQSSDYTDYAEAYDNLYASVGGLAGYFYYQDNAGNTIDPRQRVIGTDHFKKFSQEVRVASPAEDPLRVVAGLFYQHQSNFIHQEYDIAGLGDIVSVNGQPGILWLTQQYRVDKDYAMFGEASFDIAPTLTLTGGLRGYIYDNSLIGFFGFGRNPGGGFTDTPYNGAGSSRTGVAQCFTTEGLRLRDALDSGGGTTLLPPEVEGGPCTNLATFSNGTLSPVEVSGKGVTYRLNATWKPTPGVMLYATASRGFRPGGINRRADVAPYREDTLENYEAGAKLTLMGGMLRLNTAVYQQNWNNFQFSFLGANSFTEIHNGPNARIRGIEADANFNSGGLSLSASAAYTDAVTTRNLCLIDDPTYVCADNDGDGNIVSAPSGTRLPVTPRFKASGTARYTAQIGSNTRLYGQANVVHQSSASADIRTAIYQAGTGDIISPAALLGRLPAYTAFNFALGGETGGFSYELFIENAFDERGQISRFQQCGSCGQRPYVVPITPRLIGIRAGYDF